MWSDNPGTAFLASMETNMIYESMFPWLIKIAQHIWLSYLNTNCKMPPLVGNNNMQQQLRTSEI